MFLAPDYQLHGQRITIPDGMRGIESTIVTMRAMVDEFKAHPDMRNTAIGIIYNTPEKDQQSEAESLFRYVRDCVRYTRDVFGIETLATPDVTLKTRIGDCDDQVTLLATLLESVGYPSRFVVASYNDDGKAEHVYMQAIINDEWVDMDPTEPQPMGYAPPDPTRLWYETR
jgi:hypothetical protein